MEEQPIPVAHDWEDIPLEPTGKNEINTSYEVDGKTVELSLKLNISYAYSRKVKDGPKGDGTDDVYERVHSSRRCRRCGQISENYGEPQETCRERQVREVMEE